jgi:ABC-2 type transport system permease protein
MAVISHRRIWTMFVARNHEFFRDRAAFGWNFIFPFLIIIGFGIIFSEDSFHRYTVGVFPSTGKTIPGEHSIPPRFAEDPAIALVPVDTMATGLDKLRRHKIDLLLDGTSSPPRYWLNDASPAGAIAEKILVAATFDLSQVPLARERIDGAHIRYIDWFFPGIMAMNMMFSALWGVGYIVVRYRKNGALKRLKATPLSAFEYLSAQMISRIFLIMFTFVAVWVGTDLIFDFHMQGSIILFFGVFLLGGLSLCSIGLLLAARGISEEFTAGALNFITWPMMFLSEVWFSLERAPHWVQQLAWLFPLTHLLKAARKVMNEGANLVQIAPECLLMTATTLIFLTLAAWLFSWTD